MEPGDASMTKRIEAVYSNGVLRPVEDLGLTEGQRVRLTVELVDEPVDRAAAIANLRAAVTDMQFRSSGPLPTRDELHERWHSQTLFRR
jgi:predicted DNA-binding antitoxin AbrB/MazE fold protein